MIFTFWISIIINSFVISYIFFIRFSTKISILFMVHKDRAAEWHILWWVCLHVRPSADKMEQLRSSTFWREPVCECNSSFQTEEDRRAWRANSSPLTNQDRRRFWLTAKWQPNILFRKEVGQPSQHFDWTKMEAGLLTDRLSFSNVCIIHLPFSELLGMGLRAAGSMLAC